MVPLEAPYPDVYTDTFIFFLRPLCKIIWMNVHYFPNAPRICKEKGKNNDKKDHVILAFKGNFPIKIQL